MNVENKSNLDHYTSSLQDSDDIVMYYSDDIQYGDGFNKKLVDFAYTFNKAIILKDESATIVELSTWRDYDDDKIQIKLQDGTCILTEIDKVKLVNDEEAAEGAVDRYAASLVGSEDKVIHYGAKGK